MSIKGGCGRSDCSTSTGIHDDESSYLSGLTFGTGVLDDHGYWSEPCDACARAFEREHPEAAPCWPFAHMTVADFEKSWGVGKRANTQEVRDHFASLYGYADDDDD